MPDVITPPTTRPSYAASVERIRLVQARDAAETALERISFLLDHGGSVEQAIVLFHGLTNSPPQMRALAEQLHAAGANVYVPRAPFHGLADRMTRRQGRLRAEHLKNAATDALEASRGLGQRLVVFGFSMGGVQAAWLAQHRADISRAVIMAPALSVLNFHPAVSPLLGRTLVVAPDHYIWWDPRKREQIEPVYAYPRFSTRALGQILRLAAEVQAGARLARPLAQSILVITTARDLAISPAAVDLLVHSWRRHGADIETFRFGHELPWMHDILDPGQPGSPAEVVLPRLVSLILEKNRATGVEG
jgi:alpha-beta hydrolase superfamily lysophospholipase